jgi:hypothetical protein
MRKLFLTLVPAMAIAAAPAFAQSSVSSETTTSTVNAPAASETTKEVYKQDTNMPEGQKTSESKSVKKTTTDGLGDTSEMSKTEHHVQVDGVDGSHSESSSTTTRTSPN